jgi:hypothetical protein
MNIRLWFWLSLLFGPRLATRLVVAYWLGALIAAIVILSVLLALPLAALQGLW